MAILSCREDMGEESLLSLVNGNVKKAEGNKNFAFNPNDIATK